MRGRTSRWARGRRRVRWSGNHAEIGVRQGGDSMLFDGVALHSLGGPDGHVAAARSQVQVDAAAVHGSMGSAMILTALVTCDVALRRCGAAVGLGRTRRGGEANAAANVEAPDAQDAAR